MAFKPAEEKPLRKTSAEIKVAPPEVDLELEEEAPAETAEKPAEQKIAPEPTEARPPRPAPKPRPAMPPPAKDEVIIKIEKIMEEGLNDSFQRLSPVAKQEFKLKGEQAALQIRDLLKGARVKVKKILRLILDWLRILPGINHFFLEQEAKIKTDKIIALKNKF